MKINDWKSFVKKSRNKYMRIKYIACPAFGGENIYFTQAGFNHLLRKGRLLRNRREQRKRIELLKYVPSLIASFTKFSRHERTYKFGIPSGAYADFWSFVIVEKEMSITIIIRQLSGGQKHFFSVFSRP